MKVRTGTTASVFAFLALAATPALAAEGLRVVANIPLGARVSGTGVGREVYVSAKNVGAGTVTVPTVSPALIVIDEPLSNFKVTSVPALLLKVAV